MHALLPNLQNTQSLHPYTKRYWNTYNLSVQILRHYSWLKTIFYSSYQATGNQIQPNYPTLSGYSPHGLGCWQKDPYQIKQISNATKSWLCLLHIWSSQKVLPWELENIHHQGFCIALGAFTISPIESLYIEANESPLSLREHKLALHYYAPKTLSITASWK